MASSPEHPASPPGPVSLDLLEPLKNRSDGPWMSDREERVDPDPRYIAGLRRILAADIKSHAIAPHDLTDVLTLVVDKMGSVRKAKGSEATWSMPGELWVEHAAADPRTTLVSWLIHQGADPWAVNTPAIVKGESRWSAFHTTVGLMLTQGYIGATQQALRLPHAHLQDLGQLCPNRWDCSSKQVNLVQMAAHVGAIRVLEHMHKVGQDMDDALWHARDADTVRVLVNLSARTTGKGGPNDIPLAAHWAQHLPAQAVRPMMAVIATSMTPAAAVLSASQSTRWAPLKDAIKACPDWQDVKAPVISGLELRLPAALIVKASGNSNEAVAAQALRVLAMGTPDNRQVVPGLTEKSLVRLALNMTANRLKTRGRNASSKKMHAQAQSLLEKLADPGTVEQALVSDATAFSSACEHMPLLIRHAAITNMILEHRLATPDELRRTANNPPPPGLVAFCAKALPSRTADDLLAISRMLHASIIGPTPSNLGGFSEVFGLGIPSRASQKQYGPVATEGKWLDRLWDENPSRRPEIARAGTIVTCYLMTHVGLMSQKNTDIALEKWAARIEKWIDQGVDTGIDASFASTVATIAANHPNEHARRFTQSLRARISRLDMDASVGAGEQSTRSGPRF